MSALAFTFGSFGDITSLLGIAWKLSTSLANLRGASGELGELIADVDMFTRMLKQVNVVLIDPRSALQDDVRRGILLSLSVCRTILLEMNHKIPRPTRGGARAVLVWDVFGGRQVVDSMRARLAEQVELIQVYLTLAQRSDQKAVLVHVQDQGVILEELVHLVQGIKLCVGKDIRDFRFYNTRTQSYYLPCARVPLESIYTLPTYDLLKQRARFLTDLANAYTRVLILLRMARGPDDLNCIDTDVVKDIVSFLRTYPDPEFIKEQLIIPFQRTPEFTEQLKSFDEQVTSAPKLPRSVVSQYNLGKTISILPYTARMVYVEDFSVFLFDCGMEREAKLAATAERRRIFHQDMPVGGWTDRWEDDDDNDDFNDEEDYDVYGEDDSDVEEDYDVYGEDDNADYDADGEEDDGMQL
ncbi:hypothetical protein AURDEDRAFT_170262 [Auricularia subglabra TFB-10046 SS5]|nr:hypothetical protein AURDEDRAFT_170262 [Auricularia subglabra TFB-10046 SS5]